MKKLLFLVGLFLFSGYVYAQTDCAAYRTGYFMFTDSLDNPILIHRKKNYQYQYDPKTKVRTQYRLNWINDCEYSITQAITNSKSLRKYKNSVKKIVISKSGGENGYYYTCSCIDNTLKGKESFLKKITKEKYYDLFYN